MLTLRCIQPIIQVQSAYVSSHRIAPEPIPHTHRPNPASSQRRRRDDWAPIEVSAMRPENEPAWPPPPSSSLIDIKGERTRAHSHTHTHPIRSHKNVCVRHPSVCNACVCVCMRIPCTIYPFFMVATPCPTLRGIVCRSPITHTHAV